MAFTKALTAVICVLPFPPIKPALLNLIGHRVHRSVRIRPSLVTVRSMVLGPSVSIGFANWLAFDRLVMREKAYIGSLNHVHGDFSVQLGYEAAIGNRNRINRGPYLGERRPARLKMGELSKITASHYVNLIRSVTFGDFSALGGAGSQIWTHGFVHHEKGRGRDEISRPVTIGNNVYIGSMTCINPGVTIADGIAIGAHSSVAGNLSQPGMYVSQRLRHIARA
jgi:acetyltransferase-like isoleucine patch superfamily enzyme